MIGFDLISDGYAKPIFAQLQKITVSKDVPSTADKKNAKAIMSFGITGIATRHGAESNGDSCESLKIMVEGKRLRDIADLPLDLAV
jgi:hypothetical protein